MGWDKAEEAFAGGIACYEGVGLGWRMDGLVRRASTEGKRGIVWLDDVEIRVEEESGKFVRSLGR